MRILALLPLLFLLAACGQNYVQDNTESASTASTVVQKADVGIANEMAAQMAMIDSFLEQDSLDLEVWAKTKSYKYLLPVEGYNWPENLEKVYNVWRYPAGAVAMMTEVPISESGDWQIVYRHYFDEKGHTYAFRRTNSFFNSVCTYSAYEINNRYFDQEFQQVGATYVMIDTAGQPLDTSACEFPYNYEFAVHPDTATYFQAISYARMES